VDQTENRITRLEDKVDLWQLSDKEKETKKSEWKVKAFWNNIKRPNLQIIGLEG
jgi:hypothetical protein